MASTRCLSLLILALCMSWSYGLDDCYDLTGTCLASPSFVLLLPSSDSVGDRWLQNVYTSMQFCLAQTTNTTCLANAGTIHMCTTTSTGGCISLRGHSEPIACVVDYQKAKSTGANATLANGTAACEIAERIFRPCYDYTNQSDCAAATGCSWNAANPSAINYDICFPTDLPDSKDAVLAELNATWVPAIKAQDDLCRTLLPATNCQAAIMPVSIPPVIPLYKQCGGAGGGCTSFTCVDAPFPNTSCEADAICKRSNEYYWQCMPPPAPKPEPTTTSTTTTPTAIPTESTSATPGTSTTTTSTTGSSTEVSAAAKTDGATLTATPTPTTSTSVSDTTAALAAKTEAANGAAASSTAGVALAALATACLYVLA